MEFENIGKLPCGQCRKRLALRAGLPHLPVRKVVCLSGESSPTLNGPLPLDKLPRGAFVAELST